jgi:hypothetical protein
MVLWKQKQVILWFSAFSVPFLTLFHFRLSQTYLSLTYDNNAINATNDSLSVKVKAPFYSQQESFAACILVLDQNHRLTEWIAYHYFALPLRTLIVAYDPKSTLRARKLVQRWKSVMNIIEWEDDDYLPPNWAAQMTRIKGDVGVHRRRQPRFMKECTKIAASQKIKRVLHADVDEYLRINRNVVSTDIVNASEPGHITKFLNQLEHKNNTLFPESTNGYGRACTCFSRYHYVQVLNDPSNRMTHEYNSPASSFVGKEQEVYFDTLRYPYRAGFITGLPKGIINLKYISNPELSRAKNDVHLPLGKEYCERPNLNTTLFIFNHYIGSYESFLYSVHNDPRYNMTRDKWEERVYGGGGMLTGQDAWKTLPPVLDDTIVEWLPAFYQWQSEEVASWLLRDTGLRAVLPELMAEYPNISNSYYDRDAEKILINALSQQ